MVIALLLIVIALLIGGVGLVVKGLAWALFIALALLVIGAIVGMTSRSRART